MPKQQKAHVSRHHEGAEPDAMLIRRFDDGPHNQNAEAKEQRLADQPSEPQALASEPGDGFAHHQSAEDAAIPRNRNRRNHLSTPGSKVITTRRLWIGRQ